MAVLVSMNPPSANGARLCPFRDEMRFRICIKDPETRETKGRRGGERDTIMANPESGDPDGDAAMRARLKDLSGALDDHRKAAGMPRSPSGGLQAPNGMGQAMSLGFRVMSEFVAAVVVGGFIGWMIDRGLGTSPAALIVFLGLGTAAGFWSVYRIAMRPTASPGGVAGTGPKGPPPGGGSVR